MNLKRNVESSGGLDCCIGIENLIKHLTMWQNTWLSWVYLSHVMDKCVNHVIHIYRWSLCLYAIWLLVGVSVSEGCKRWQAFFICIESWKLGEKYFRCANNYSYAREIYLDLKTFTPLVTHNDVMWSASYVFFMGCMQCMVFHYKQHGVFGVKSL